MVAMVVGDQDIGHSSPRVPAPDDRPGFGSVDRGGRPRRRIVDQVAEIVGEQEGANFRGHDISVIPKPARAT